MYAIVIYIKLTKIAMKRPEMLRTYHKQDKQTRKGVLMYFYFYFKALNISREIFHTNSYNISVTQPTLLLSDISTKQSNAVKSNEVREKQVTG